jgi:SNF2 family DNA or RNA helicase
MRKDMLAWVGEHEDEPVSAPVVIAQLTRLQQFSDAFGTIDKEAGKMVLADPSTKLDAVMQILGSTAEQVVIFSQFSQVIKLLGKRLEKAKISHGLFIGDTPAQQRSQIISDFQSGKLKVFAGTIQAGGVGITLTAASTVVFIDRTWSPSLNRQAVDRLHRIGQKNAVQVIDIISRGTIDTKRHEEIDLKWEWIKMLLGEEDD